MKVPLTVSVNGEKYDLEIKPNCTLLDVLREYLGLTGTKKGCGSGKCGSCTVLLGGQPVNACLVLAPQVNGKEILTIEGLASDKPHPLQIAFVEKGAIQCGYCTPGMILTAYALLERNPQSDDSEIKAAISGNLCRCTGYNKIVEAIKSCTG
ncbi:MAG: 2Fe-2S iron-sulfur cluster binding domain-containing protein [Proteobacteria bacterium]|nr:2Fe-2S iron-sulfur cluster binding domain-containing protein [Pseudomonadota bacterium]